MSLGELTHLLEKYLALRRALGFAMQSEERLLRDLVRFFEERGGARPLRAHLAVAWAQSTAATCGPGRQGRRLSVARGFLFYLSAFDPQTEVPDRGLLPGAVRPRPYILSETEIEVLLNAARSLGPRGSLRPSTFTTLISLLLSTGLRAGEALRLQHAEVDLQARPPVLKVHKTKFRKSRWVPLHSTAAVALQAYDDQRSRLDGERSSKTFFVSHRGTPLRYRTVSGTFVRLARQLVHGGPIDQRRPSLHCLRHTFAVRRLLAWYREGCDIYARLPELSVYLGHVRPEETYWYLSATPELLRVAATRFETYVQPGDHP